MRLRLPPGLARAGFDRRGPDKLGRSLFPGGCSVAPTIRGHPAIAPLVSFGRGTYDRTMTALGDSMHTLHSVLLKFTPDTAARRF